MNDGSSMAIRQGAVRPEVWCGLDLEAGGVGRPGVSTENGPDGPAGPAMVARFLRLGGLPAQKSGEWVDSETAVSAPVTDTARQSVEVCALRGEP